MSLHKLVGCGRPFRDHRIASFNLLCDGLSYDEFFCVEGETNKFTAWSYREDKLATILTNMFKGTNPEQPNVVDSKCSIIVTQENDHYYQLLRKIRLDPQCGNVAGVFGATTKVSKSKVSHGTAFRVKAQRLLRGANITDESVLMDKGKLYENVNHAFLTGALNHLKATSERNFDGQRAMEVIRSFREECGNEFLSQALDIFGGEATADDLYLSDDGIGILYDKDAVELLDIGLPQVDDPKIFCESPSYAAATSIAVQGIGHAIRCLFKIQPGYCAEGKSKYILLYGGHLKSGEGVKDAITRYAQMKEIIEDSENYLTIHRELLNDGEVIPVFAMDSNNSKFYEESYPARGSFVRVPSADKNTPDLEVEVEFSSTLSEYLELNNLIDGIHLQDVELNGRNQCLKMRNGKTEQKSKAFQLMFDTIDKIIVPTSQPVIFDCCNYFGFKTYDSTAGSFFAEVRSSKKKRRDLYDEMIKNVESACVKDALGMESPFAQLYPNEFAPSDHPPVSLVLKL